MILAVDASSVTAAAALCSDHGAVVRSDFLHNGLTHSETLLPMIRRVVGDTSVADLDAIAVTAGPGSFTGVRIGVEKPVLGNLLYIVIYELSADLLHIVALLLHCGLICQLKAADVFHDKDVLC